MKKLPLILLMLPQMAAAQNAEPDSLKANTLDEVTVVAASQWSDATKTVYIPSARQKSSASDGFSLLARMNIPQLNVNPINEMVNTVSGQAVSLFINWHQASPEDIAGLYPSDVKRVEYLDYPADPRFLRAEHVVNYVLNEYAYGGYTKLSGKERFIVNSGNASVYSKFVFHRMEYDLMIDGEYDNNRHTGESNTELYRFDNGDVERQSSVSGGKYRQHRLFAGVRTSWKKSEHLVWRNLVSYRRINTPVGQTSGYISFSRLFTSDNYTSESRSENSAVDFNSELYGDFGRGWSIQSNVMAEILDNSASDDYSTSQTSLLNHAAERGWSGRINAQINKEINQKVSLFTNFVVGASRSLIDYSGTSNATNRFSEWFGGCYLGMSLSLEKLSGSIDGGYAVESNAVNGHRDNDSYPFTHVNLQYTPDQKNSLTVWFQYATLSPGASMKNPNMVQQTEMMYIAGNADLKRSRIISTNLTYTWLPCNRWQITSYATFFKIINRQIPIYTPTAPDGMMLKRYANSGDYNHGQIGVRLTCKFLDGNLNVSMSPRLLIYETTGENRMSHYPFLTSANVDYYLGDFSLSGYWSTKSSYVDGETCYLRRFPSEYAVTAGWSAKGWNVNISIANFLHNSWQTSHDTFASRWYDSRLTQFGTDFHRRISLTVSYTFNYGKRVRQNQAIESSGEVSTSILR